MPTSIVDISITTDTSAIPQESFSTIGLIGTSDSSPPSAELGVAERYSDSGTVADDYGDTSKVAISSSAVQEMGVSEWYVLVLEEIAVTGESLSDNGMGTLKNFPILGEPEPSVATGEISYVAGTPDNTITTGVELNPDTGDYYNAESGNTIDYSYADWGGLTDAFKGLGINLPIMADKKYDVKDVGTLDEIVGWADKNRAATIAPSVNGALYQDEQKPLSIAHEVNGYVPNGNCLGVAHKSSADVGAYIAGQASVNDPWFDVFYDGDGYPFDTEYYRAVNVGDPGTPETFEGGDENSAGPTNVIINKAGINVLSNSLSTAGASSSYAFWDIKRTQNYAEAQIETALDGLRLGEDRIPFTEEGRLLIQSALGGAFTGLVGGVNDPFSEVNINVPPVESLTQSNKANRVYEGITVDATLSGNVHQFTLNLNIGV